VGDDSRRRNPRHNQGRDHQRRISNLDGNHEAILMELSAQERFAIAMLFKDSDPFCSAVREGLAAAEVVERKFTGVGFFTTIHFTEPLPTGSERSQWDWNFSHRKLSHGGSFMGWREGTDRIGLEGVSHHGDWPEVFEPLEFSET
jgi:hypothetical protein